jgi:radical SAM superfamily enzyme YgiQ (UPF0313 family)
VKIVLILPHDSTYRHETGSFGRTLRYPPLTLTILAGLVPRELDADVRIVDEGVETLADDLTADLVGITALTATAPRAYRLADQLRANGIPVVLGGVHPTVMPDEAARHADAVVIGFAEESWPRLLRDFRNGTLERFYKSSGSLDLAGLPLPRRELLRKRSYLTLNTVMATRGCPNRCHYCCLPVVLQGKYYQRPVADVVHEIRQLRGRRVIFLDPSPNEDREYAKRLYRAVAPLGIQWVGLTTTRMMEDGELLDLAVQSGCFGLLFGFETISQEALCQSGKGFNHVQHYRDIVGRLHDRGVSVLGCFMFGFDSDDTSTFERTLSFVEETNIDLLRYTVFTPFPGTQVYDDLKRQGRIFDHDWAHYDYEHVVFRPARMEPEALEDGVRFMWRETYSLRAIGRRMCRTDLHRWGNLIYNFGFRHHAMAVGRDRDQQEDEP